MPPLILRAVASFGSYVLTLFVMFVHCLRVFHRVLLVGFP